MSYGFTTLRDLGTADPEWPTIDLRNTINAGLVEGPRLVVAAHILGASAGHGDLRGFYNSRWNLPISTIADDIGSIKAIVRREHTFGGDWIKTTNTGGRELVARIKTVLRRLLADARSTTYPAMPAISEANRIPVFA